MALNYSRRPIFPAYNAEVRRGFRLEEKMGEGEFDKGGCRDELDGCSSRDIIDLLPTDPFGMDIETTVTAISGWLEDLGVDDYGGCGMNSGMNEEDFGLFDFSGVSVMWKPPSLRFQSKWKLENNLRAEQRNINSNEEENNGGGGFKGDGDSSYATDVSVSDSVSVSVSVSTCDDNGGSAAPHDALLFAIGYLGVKDLLSLGMVCKSLYNTVQNDTWLWRNIHIEQPLNERITDEVLLKLTSRAQGNLQCLTLVECSKITDTGIRRVLQSNPRLNKLCVPGCTKLSIEGIVTSLKAFNSEVGSQTIRHLRIGGLSGVSSDHFEDLKLLLGADKHQKEKDHKPHFLLRGKMYVLCDDDRAIDIEVCPRCEKYRLVYDCPSEACQAKDHDATTALCRACAICIPRCAQCGRCFNDSEYEETFCLDNICSDCCQRL